MSFNIDKCEVMHFRFSVRKSKSWIPNEWTKTSWDYWAKWFRGNSYSNDIKVGKQCDKVANKGNQNTRVNKANNHLQKKRLHFKPSRFRVYCACRPHLVKYIEKLEKVQRRATQMMEECRGKSYKERIQMLGLTTLETRSQDRYVECLQDNEGLLRDEWRLFFSEYI